MIEIEKIKRTVDELMHKDFTIIIEDGTIVDLNFQIRSFFHLLGFHYLSDLPDVSNPKRKDEVVRRFLRGTLSLETLEKSVFYDRIKNRIESFPAVEDMLLHNRCKIIVDFNSSLLKSTSIKTRYFLYQTDDYVTYRLFGIGCSGEKYYPETFFVERSKYYISNQQLLECKIIHREHDPKSRLSGAHRP